MMDWKIKYHTIFLYLLVPVNLESFNSDTEPSRQILTKDERIHLREEAREIFYHGYNSYMDNAYPADELMPLSCKGRWREKETPRGDIDLALGNYSLTLIDSLDTLIILGDLEEFERAIQLIIRDVSFDRNLVVSVFETNIRVVGGLISGHILAEHINQLYGVASWYRGELLTMAQDVATRLLPAFNTSTGIPYPKVNLRHGMNFPQLQTPRDTCTACAGTIILEFASLSRLTGQPVFEEKARAAMDYLWGQRHRGSDLVGTVLNIHSGDWIRRDSGVGAGIDSYYEYLLKAYVLLGDEGYLDRFNKHYSAIMKYVSQGPMLLDVHMHRPHTTSRNFMDSLHAFWPGLQVLKGDIKPAIETHEMLYQVIQRHNFLPEAFTTDFQVHWGEHPLRPEFVESTYLLYQATGDHYYLRVGEQVLRSLQKYAWVPCGYAAVKDVRTGVHEDRMDSFVLAETFKYLFLLFAEPSDLPINLDEFIFTTEAHLLPLSLARLSNLTTVPLPNNQTDPAEDIDVEYARSCPNAHYLFPGRHKFAETIRQPLKNFVNNICPSRKAIKRKLRASEFQVGNEVHVGLLKDMGITIMSLLNGRIQLLHTASNAKSPHDAEEGLLFMQEMLELTKLQQDQPENPPRAVSFFKSNVEPGTIQSLGPIIAGPAHFGKQLTGDTLISAPVIIAEPFKACKVLDNKDDIKGRIVIMERGDCMFVEKARQIESLGAIGGIVVDYNEGYTSKSSPMFAMSGDGTDDVTIPLVFLYRGDSQPLLDAIKSDPNIQVVLTDYADSASTVVTPAEDKDNFIQAAGPTVKESLMNYQDITIETVRDSIRQTQSNSDIQNSIYEYLKQNEKMSDDEAINPLTSYISNINDLHKMLLKEFNIKLDTSKQMKELLSKYPKSEAPMNEVLENYADSLVSNILTLSNTNSQTGVLNGDSCPEDTKTSPPHSEIENKNYVDDFIHDLERRIETVNINKDLIEPELYSELLDLLTSIVKKKMHILEDKFKDIQLKVPSASSLFGDSEIKGSGMFKPIDGEILDSEISNNKIDSEILDKKIDSAILDNKVDSEILDNKINSEISDNLEADKPYNEASNIIKTDKDEL